VVEFHGKNPKGTTILLNDAGRATTAADVEKLLKAGQRVLAVDLLYVGECKVEKNFLFALLMASVGDRPLGVEAAQLNAVARWATKRRGEEVTVHATGPRTSLVALTAAALDLKAISRVEMTGGLASLKEAIEQNRGVDQWPEVFCFGLLEATDVKHLVAVTA